MLIRAIIQSSPVHYYFPFSHPSSASIDNDNEWNAHYLGRSCRSGNSYRRLVGGSQGEESSVCLVPSSSLHHDTVIIFPSCLSISLSYRLFMRSDRIHSLRSFVTIDNCAPLMIRLIRTSVALTLTCTYLMWAITYLAQLHPLIGEFLFSAWLSSFSLLRFCIVLLPMSRLRQEGIQRWTRDGMVGWDVGNVHGIKADDSTSKIGIETGW